MASNTTISTWYPAHYVSNTQRHASSVVGLASALLPTLVLAALCLSWRVTQTWRSMERSLQRMFIGDFALAALAIVYLVLILHATCVAEVGTAFETLNSSSSLEEERSWFFTLNLLSIALLSASRALAWVFGSLYVADIELLWLARISNVSFYVCIAWGVAAIAALPSTCSTANTRLDFLSGECEHSVCPNCIMHLIGSLLDVGYSIWGAAFCHLYLRASDGHFAHLSAGAKRAHKESRSAQYVQWQKRRSTAAQVFVPHALRLFAIIPMAFQFSAFDASPTIADDSPNQARFAAWQCMQVSWLCICTLLQPAMAALYNLRSELVTADTLLSTSASNRAIGDVDRHGRTRTHVQSTRKGEGASKRRDSLDTESSTRDLTSGIVQERTFQVEEHYGADAGIQLQEMERRSWNGKT